MMRRKWRFWESTLYIKILVFSLGLIMIPLAGMFFYIKSSYEKFIEQEIGANLSRQIEKSEEDINELLENMIQLSNGFLADENLKKIYFKEEADKYSYYEKMKIFDRYLSNISVYNIIGFQDIKITFIDAEETMYTNWSMNYKDYHFLFEQDWIQNGVAEHRVVWRLFTDTFNEKTGGEKYVSVARPVLDENDSSQILGILYISVNDNIFRSVLQNYLYTENDSVGIYDNYGQCLLTNEKEEYLSPTQASGIIQETLEGKRFEKVITLNGTKYLITSYPINVRYSGSEEKLITIHLTDFQNVTDSFSQISSKMTLFLVVFLLALIAMLLLLVYGIVTPVKQLSCKMQEYKLGEIITGLDIQRKDELGMLNRSFLAMSYKIEELFKKLKEEHHVRELYYYESLRAQMTPHFLFNSLNTIRWMAIIKGEEAIVAGIDALSNMLKYNMNKTGELVTLREELENIQNYIYIQNLRYGSRLEITVDMDEKLYAYKMIKFILQPIVENAVIHAFKENADGKIYVYGYAENNMLKIFVEDNGKGFSEEAISDFQNRKKDEKSAAKKMTGIGISNVDYRIKVEYGEPYGIELDFRKKKGTTVIFTLPIISGEGEEDEKGSDCG